MEYSSLADDRATNNQEIGQTGKSSIHTAKKIKNTTSSMEAPVAIAQFKIRVCSRTPMMHLKSCMDWTCIHAGGGAPALFLLLCLPSDFCMT